MKAPVWGEDVFYLKLALLNNKLYIFYMSMPLFLILSPQKGAERRPVCRQKPSTKTTPAL
jgi:hypothetical protein